jgi:hypothetical protein
MEFNAAVENFHDRDGWNVEVSNGPSRWSRCPLRRITIDGFAQARAYRLTTAAGRRCNQTAIERGAVAMARTVMNSVVSLHYPVRIGRHSPLGLAFTSADSLSRGSVRCLRCGCAALPCGSNTLAVNFGICRLLCHNGRPLQWVRASPLFGMVECVVCEGRGLGGQDLEGPLEVCRFRSAPAQSCG